MICPIGLLGSVNKRMLIKRSVQGVAQRTYSQHTVTMMFPFSFSSGQTSRCNTFRGAGLRWALGQMCQADTVPKRKERAGFQKEARNTFGRTDCCVVWGFCLCGSTGTWRKRKQQNWL